MLFSLLLTLLSAQPFFTSSPTQIDAALQGLQKDALTYEQRVAEVVKLEMGTPYADGPLGEGPEGKYDQDPLMDLSRVDCVTFIEQTLALAASDSYEDAFNRLQQIRYKGGKIDYESRNHFWVADWVANNAWCEAITAKVSPVTATLTRTISKKDFFQLVKAPELGQDVRDQEITISYIPVAAVSAVEDTLPSPVLIAFVGKKPAWLFTLHTGMFIRGEDGKGKLVHASSKAGKVVEMDLSDYVESQAGRYLGIAVYAVFNSVGQE